MPPATPTSTAVDMLRRRTVLGHRVAARDLHQHMTGYLTTCSEAAFAEQTRVAAVLLKRMKCMMVIRMVVVMELTWADIANHFGITEHHALVTYGEPVNRWCAGEAAPWAPVLCAGPRRVRLTGFLPINITESNIDKVQAEIDAYKAR